jgi:glycosyltransferase involved in cell wall biosynthesis
MNHGVPVVTTHEEGIEDIIEDRQNGFLFKTPEDFEEILTLSVDQGFIQCISEKARQTVLERFNINRIAEAYMRLWNIHG